MTIAIRYDSKTGNTRRLAQAMADALNTAAEPVSTPLPGHVDLLLLGSSVYAAGASEEIKQFILKLTPAQVGRVACFGTAALLPSTYPQVSRLLRKQGVAVDEKEFHCRGQFHFMHRGKPDESDLSAAREFAKAVAGDKA